MPSISRPGSKTLRGGSTLGYAVGGVQINSGITILAIVGFPVVFGALGGLLGGALRPTAPDRGARS